MKTEPPPTWSLSLLEPCSAGGDNEPALCLYSTGWWHRVTEIGPNPAQVGHGCDPHGKHCSKLCLVHALLGERACPSPTEPVTFLDPGQMKMRAESRNPQGPRVGAENLCCRGSSGLDLPGRDCQCLPRRSTISGGDLLEVRDQLQLQQVRVRIRRLDDRNQCSCSPAF